MSTHEHNNQEMSDLIRVRDEIKWYIGEQLGRDPDASKEDSIIVDLALAHWILNKDGGAWMASRIKESHGN